VLEVRFFCETSLHGRVIHFKTPNEWQRSVAFSGSPTVPNLASQWTSGFTTLSGHSAYLPAATTDVYAATLWEFPFYKGGNYHWAMRGAGGRWECDDYADSAGYTTRHSIYVRMAA